MSEAVQWLILLGTVGAVALALVVVVRMPSAFRDVNRTVREELRTGREEARSAARDLREEVSGSSRVMNETVSRTFEGVTKQVKDLRDSNQIALDRIRDTVDARVKSLQEGNERKLDEVRKEASQGLKATSEALSETLEGMNKNQRAQIEGMTEQLRVFAESSQSSLDRIRETVDLRVKDLQEGNERKLEEMRRTVDEKLHDTLEKRLGDSFKLVSDRLEAVHKGLGEMQSLATGVGDLKRVLTNVKARGTWAEVQLGSILEEILTREQFEKNVCIRPESSERVEFAVRLPGPKDDPESCVWLPIDSKFPQEDYLRLQDAAEKAEPREVQAAVDALARTIRAAAKDICDKYVSPPNTTDFGIMFLATEGLYAEVLRQPALFGDLQHQYRVVVAGPTTLAAILNSLRMGFQTLAVEQRAAEVWRVLGAIKTEFSKFGEVLDKVKRQLTTASRTIDETGVRSRTMERKLRSVERLPEAEAARILALAAPVGDREAEDEDEPAEGITDTSPE
jgi:DNA recombination protein RmuC